MPIERTVRGTVQDIVSALEKKEITYDQAKSYLKDFTKDRLSCFILKEHETENTDKPKKKK
jgi:hypothetical protein